MKNPSYISIVFLAGAVSGTTFHAMGQAGPQLPIYQVTRSGATDSQGSNLVYRLGLPMSMVGQTNGQVSFVDPTNYLAVPSMPVRDPAVTEPLLAVTKNPYPAIPISFRAIDFDALANLPVLNDDIALRTIVSALDAAGLTPQFGTPAVGHTTFTAFYTNDNGLVISNSQPLDTQVSYQFRTPNGYPMVGPGAQVQINYGPTNNVTRLLYSTRELTAGPMVDMVLAEVASNRLASLFPANATITSEELVYWCPPFLRPWPPPGPYTPAAILPWYVGHASVYSPGEFPGSLQELRLKPRAIPATDNQAFVPSINLQVSSPDGSRINAAVVVAGGAPPYTILWSGSDPTIFTNPGPAISYLPTARVAFPPLALSPMPANASVMASWPASSAGFILEWSADLASTNWLAITNPVEMYDGTNYVMMPLPPSQTGFFRLRLLSQSLIATETVGVRVIDANGVIAHANQGVVVQIPVDRVAKGGPPVVGYGTESPREPDFAVDRIGWQNGMGSFLLGGGAQIFCWMGDTAWPGDFIEPPTPGMLPATPWVHGDADYSNWGINTAAIVLNNTDGCADYFASSQPGSTIAEYATAALARPTNPGWTVVINWLNYNNTATTHYYPLNYKYSWGPLGPNDNLNWLLMDCCDVLDETNSSGLTPDQRWGPAFGGLHILTGWNSEEAVGDGSFEEQFALDMLGGLIPLFNPPQQVVQAWFNSAHAAGIDHGIPAAMGPNGPGGICDYFDYYWGKGAVGPTIPPSKITGWWYVHGP